MSSVSIPDHSLCSADCVQSPKNFTAPPAQVIPDDAVDAVARRNYEAEWDYGWDSVLPAIKYGFLNEARKQCAAAAPHLTKAAQVAAWEEGFTACAGEHTKQRQDPGYPITRTNPYRKDAL